METKLRPGNPYFTTAVYYLSFIGLGMATAVLGPTLQGLAKNTGTTLAQISSLFLFTSLGYLLGSFTAGRVYDRVRGHPILSIALLTIGVMMLAVPLMRDLLFLQVLFFIIGTAEGNLDVGINTLIVWLHGHRAHPFMNGLHAFYGIGTTTAPLIAAAVLSTSGTLNSIYWDLTVLILPISLLILFFTSPSNIPAEQQVNRTDLPVPALVFLTVVVFFAFTGAELGFAGWIYTYTTSQVYATPTMAASVNAIFWAALTVGRLISVPISVKVKPQKILWVNLLGAALGLLTIIFYTSNETLLWLGTIGTGFFMGPIFPTLLNDAQTRMNITGTMTSRFFVGSSLGSMFLPWLMGQLIAPYGPTAAMIAVLCSVLLAMGTYFIVNQRTRPALSTSR